MNSDMINSMNSVNSVSSVNSITVNSKNSNLGIFTLATPCTHIKFIKLELQKEDEYIRETFEITFSRPKSEILIEFIDFSNHIIVILLEQNKLPSDLVFSNRVDDDAEMRSDGDQEKFTEKFSKTVGIFNNLFKGNKNESHGHQSQLKIENNLKANHSTLTWNIRKK
jgi:hypothetical protein